MHVTGVAYNLLLRGIMLDQGITVLWSNEVMHLFGPVVTLLDALFDHKPRALPWKSVALALTFPLAWPGYTWIGAPFATTPATTPG
ncbi:Pr6Pr family membrane protein [Glutamicibacter soli]|nr:hypothetical protein ATC04_00505 [Arthrobacter sp. YC-RL1]